MFWSVTCGWIFIALGISVTTKWGVLLFLSTIKTNQLNCKQLVTDLRKIILIGIFSIQDISMFITFRFCRDWEFRLMKIQAHTKVQGCGSGLIYYGSGSSIFAQFQIRIQAKTKRSKKVSFSNFFEINIWVKSNKNTVVIHPNFFQKVVRAILYLFSGKIFLKNN
jgi:hypothetical protein